MSTERRGPRIVGVLGGMGPDATVDLMRRVIAATPAEDDADHAHLIVDQNPRVPSRIAALIEGDGESPAPTLAAMTRRLVDMGAHAIAMPCNTAHGYLGEIRAAAGDAAVLDMVGLTADRIESMQPRPRRVGLLASTAVQITGLYEQALAERGVEGIFPHRQPAVMDAIRAVKRGAIDSAAREAVFGAAEELHAQGAELILIACTELSVMRDALPARATVLDALDVLAEAVAAFAADPHGSTDTA